MRLIDFASGIEAWKAYKTGWSSFCLGVLERLTTLHPTAGSMADRHLAMRDLNTSATRHNDRSRRSRRSQYKCPSASVQVLDTMFDFECDGLRGYRCGLLTNKSIPNLDTCSKMLM